MSVAAMNPCPCCHLGDARHRCKCTPTQIQRYRARVSGPFLDRIDLHIEATVLTISELRTQTPGESSAAMRDRQAARLAGTQVSTKPRMAHSQTRRRCAIDSTLSDLLQQAMEMLSLSARAYDRILKVARTIADLAGAAQVEAPHLLEAVRCRALDRNPGP